MDRNGIEAERLVRRFKGVDAVNGIDLTVAPGEIYGFLGPNGAGKSTTVHMLTTLLPPTSGTASVAGYDIVKQGPQVRRAIGAALQEAALDPLLTGRDHMRLQTALHGIPRGERAARSDELLERVGLSLAADRKIRTYSGGMKRRLDLALALVHRPRLLFLDEPTTGLDPRSRLVMWDVIRTQVREGATLLLTTQYLEEADELADEIAVVDHGRIIARGTADELKSRVGEVEAFEQLVGTAPGLGARELVQAPEHPQVLASRQVLVDCGVLAGEADPAAHGLGVADDVEPVHARAAPVGPEEGRQDPDRRRLARAVRPEQAEHGSLTHFEVDAVERAHLGLAGAVDLHQPLRLDRRHRLQAPHRRPVCVCFPHVLAFPLPL